MGKPAQRPHAAGCIDETRGDTSSHAPLTYPHTFFPLPVHLCRSLNGQACAAAACRRSRCWLAARTPST
eukprot:366338-Chlamydomonas_euryale.AAC.10